MGMRESESKIWQDIEVSESYLVCSMFEEAKSLASSILNQLQIQQFQDKYDMLESAGMVLLQSLHIQRVSPILDHLNQSFSSIESIPPRLVLTGVCLETCSSSSSSAVGEFLKQFLGKWRFVDSTCYEAGNFVIGVDEYLEIVELYVIKYLNDLELAISWLEAAPLPDEDTRQGLLRRLHSLHSAKATVLSQPPLSNFKEANTLEAEAEAERHINRKQQAVLRLSKRVEPCFFWFRTINLKFGNARLALSNGKIVVACLMLLVYWILRRKRWVSLKRIVERQGLYLKKAVVDLWQLAFSYQMNPLAAVQSPVAPMRVV